MSVIREKPVLWANSSVSYQIHNTHCTCHPTSSPKTKNQKKTFTGSVFEGPAWLAQQAPQYRNFEILRRYFFILKFDPCTLNNGGAPQRKAQWKRTRAPLKISEWYAIKVAPRLRSAVLENTTAARHYCHCLCLIQKTKNSPVSQQILTVNRILSWMAVVTQICLLTVSSSDLTVVHDLAVFCFFILVSVMQVYILCFGHSVRIFPFLSILYACAPYLKLFLYHY